MAREKYSQTRKERKRENGVKKIQLDKETKKKREWREKNTARQKKRENGERKIQLDNERNKNREL